MNIDEIKAKVDTILTKKENQKRFRKLKDFIDNRKNPTGPVAVTIEGLILNVNSGELKKFINKSIDDEDTTTDEAELKTLANG